MNEEQKDFVKLGVVYAAILLIFCNLIAADWRDDRVFYAVGISPYGLGIIYWPLVGCLLGAYCRHRVRFVKHLCLSLVAFYTYSVVAYTVGEGEAYVRRLWQQSALQAVLLAVYVLCGQVAVVGSLWRRSWAGHRAT